MDEEGFISPPLSILLDLVRGEAALLVPGAHAVPLRIYTGHYPFEPLVQHVAVIAFFVLSGLVVTDATRRHHDEFADYAAARLARVEPIALPAIAFTLATRL